MPRRCLELVLRDGCRRRGHRREERLVGVVAIFDEGLLGLDDPHYIFVDCVGAEPGG
jgi:hypothetical protein